jgi:hypothetical protein
MDGLMIQAPSVPEDGIVEASLERSGAGRVDAGVRRRHHARRQHLRAGSARRGPRPSQVAQLINEISAGRLEPARYGTDPIAVNLVWLVEHMTVKPNRQGRGS